MAENDSEPTTTNVDADGATTEDFRSKYMAMREHSREWEKRAKANEAAAAELEELRKARSTDEERLAAANIRAEKAESEVAGLRASMERAELVAKVSEETGVPRGLLHGDTEDELRASAEAVQSFVRASVPGYPTDKGGSATGGRVVTRESIESIKDPRARVIARARHADLYR